MKIIYRDDSGYLCVISPTTEALEQMSIEELATKLLGESKLFRIVEDSFFPENNTSEAWTIAPDLMGEILVDQNKLNELRLLEFPSLTRRQFKLALLEHSLLETVEQTIAAIENPTLKTRIQIEYNESERFERSNESVQYTLGLLSLTAEQVDEMWLYAAKL